MEVKKFSMKSVAIITILGLLLTCLFAFVATDDSYAASKKTHLRKESITLKCGNTFRQKLYDADGDVIDTSKLKFSSSDTSVATVGSKGLIKAKKEGTTTITVKYKGKTYKSQVTVKSRILFSKKNVTFTDNNPKKIKVTVDKYVDTVYFDVLHDDIVECYWNGSEGNKHELVITPLKAGKTKVKIRYYGKGEKYDYRNIIVTCEDSVKTTQIGGNLKLGKLIGIKEDSVYSDEDSTSYGYHFSTIEGAGYTVEDAIIIYEDMLYDNGFGWESTYNFETWTLKYFSHEDTTVSIAEYRNSYPKKVVVTVFEGL